MVAGFMMVVEKVRDDLGKFFGSDELLGRIPKAGEPAKGCRGFNPQRSFWDLAISAVVFDAVGMAEFV